MSDVDRAGPLVLCLVGPTAAGKTDVAARLVREFACEIISVDSAMVYRGMNIGTAKPDAAVLAAAPHHLIDIRDPWETYSAGQFCADASELIEDIHSRQRVPLLVGGTLLYFRALQHGLAPLPTADAAIRADIDQRAAAASWPALHAELAVLDPDAAARIRPTDRQRLQRALEVITLTGERLSALQQAEPELPEYSYLRIALAPGDRAVLHARIEARFDAMLNAGFVEEVEALRALPQMNADRPAMRAVGYRQFWSWLDGGITRDEARRTAIVATRRLAKRQLTWLRSEPGDLEFDCLRPNVGAEVAEEVASAVAGRLPASDA